MDSETKDLSPEEIADCIKATYSDTMTASAMGATFFSLDESHWPNFATIVTTDEHDTASRRAASSASRFCSGSLNLRNQGMVPLGLCPEFPGLRSHCAGRSSEQSLSRLLGMAKGRSGSESVMAEQVLARLQLRAVWQRGSSKPVAEHVSCTLTDKYLSVEGPPGWRFNKTPVEDIDFCMPTDGGDYGPAVYVSLSSGHMYLCTTAADRDELVRVMGRVTAVRRS